MVARRIGDGLRLRGVQTGDPELGPGTSQAGDPARTMDVELKGSPQAGSIQDERAVGTGDNDAQAANIILSGRLAPGLFWGGFFLQIEESGSPQISILQIAESSVVHRILLKLFQGFPLIFCGKIESLLFPRTMEQRAPWKSSLPLESGAGLRSNCTIESPLQSR